jgi:glycine oxidase
VALPGEEAALVRKAELREGLGIASEACRYRQWAARFYPGDALVDPREVARALIAACRARGVELHEHERVVGIAVDGRAVETARGRYECGAVLIAAGAWSSRLYPGLPETRPVRGHLIAYRMQSGTLDCMVRNNGTYVMQRSSGLLIAGSSTEDAGFERGLDEAVIADITRRACDLVPELRGHSPVERWNGLRPGITGEGPALGRIPGTAVYTAFGHYRNGILLAPETARMVAETVV